MGTLPANDIMPTPTRIESSRSVADIIPTLARAILRIAEERGHPPGQFCRGLGFRYGDLVSRSLMLSYRQTRTLILRVLDRIDDPALGIAAGACQSPVSWGLPGLAMLTFPTLGEAVLFGLQHQIEAGALVEHRLVEAGRTMHIDIAPKVFDQAVAPYLIEEAMAGALAVGRYLTGEALRPTRVELSFDGKGHEAACRHFFGCPVLFNRARNRMSLESRWLQAPLRGYDPVTCVAVRREIATLIKRPRGRHDLVESLANQLRFGIEEKAGQDDLARTLNLSDRTIRRRLAAQGTSYRALRDGTRHERAIDLLKNSDMNIADIAQAVGYSDARAFRRAFLRWTGMLPAAFRAEASRHG
jgi:AraC-like DNA-binding protein